jgi:demethylmenaquinone methyltransferase/2-methoxy-6-polyprenyl-1,4-benzoquinol methylase
MRLVLDVACGTGGVMLQVARFTPSTTRLIGIDFTEAMLRVGQQRLARDGLQRRTALGVAEAQHLPFADHTFDAVTMMFGLRNFVCPASAVAECHRVLGPGGWLYVVEFSWPQAWGVRLLYGGYFRYLLPIVAWPLSGDRSAYRYLRDSVLAFRRQPGPASLFRRAGFLDVSSIPLSGGITVLYAGRKAAT